jgi:hypothetical protein
LSAVLAADQLLAHALQPVWVKYSQRTTLSAEKDNAVNTIRRRTKIFILSPFIIYIVNYYVFVQCAVTLLKSPRTDQDLWVPRIARQSGAKAPRKRDNLRA